MDDAALHFIKTFEVDDVQKVVRLQHLLSHSSVYISKEVQCEGDSDADIESEYSRIDSSLIAKVVYDTVNNI